VPIAKAKKKRENGIRTTPEIKSPFLKDQTEIPSVAPNPSRGNGRKAPPATRARVLAASLSINEVSFRFN